MKQYFRKVLTLLGFSIIALVLTTSLTYAAALTGDYFYTQWAGQPDMNKGIDGSIVTGLVQSTLGPDGLPVVSAKGASYAGPSGSITEVNAQGELLWWNKSNLYGVTFEKTQVDTLPYAFSSNFFRDGQTNNSTYFRSVHWSGMFNLASPGSATFTLGSDDDAWLFIDGQLAIDDGGVKALLTAPTTVAGLNAGTHTLDLFFADRHTVQSALEFSASVALSPVPEPATMLLLGFGLVGLAGVRRFRK